MLQAATSLNVLKDNSVNPKSGRTLPSCGSLEDPISGQKPACWLRDLLRKSSQQLKGQMNESRVMSCPTLFQYNSYYAPLKRSVLNSGAEARRERRSNLIKITAQPPDSRSQTQPKGDRPNPDDRCPPLLLS
jgi:hypothetical protein